MRNCFEGYLTPECKNCPDWADGTDERGVGCATHYPIMWCKAFVKMFEEDQKADEKGGRNNDVL